MDYGGEKLNMVKRRKVTAQPLGVSGVRVTGKSVAYIQDVAKSGKLSKARPVVLTTVVVGAGGATPAKKPRKPRKK